MLQTVRNEVAERPSVGDGVMESEATLRIEKLKDALLKLRSTVTIDRARIETRILKENAGEPMVTRRAKAFAAIVREMPIDIDPDQLLVGYVLADRDAVDLHQEGSLEHLAGRFI